jgi:hypothetical protein
MAHKKGTRVTIWLRPETAAMVAQCMEQDAFSSMSEFFEAALLIFQQHFPALLDYIEQEEAKGFSREEIMGLVKADITFRRLDKIVPRGVVYES